MVLDAVGQVRLFLDVFIGVYLLMVFAYVLTSWIPRVPYSLTPVVGFLRDVCEPYIRIWRRILPSFGPLDFSPMVAMFGLIVLKSIIDNVLNRFH